MPRPSLKQELGERILGLPAVELHPSRFEQEREAFWVGPREFAHFHDGNEVDIRLTASVIRERREALEADPRAILGSRDWVAYRFRRRADLERALALITLAHRANR